MASFTRDAIIRSFVKLLNERPLGKITVRDIVEDCGVNRNTFYYHFADIHALVEEVSKGEIDRIIEQNAAISSLGECLDVATEFILRNRRAVLHLYDSPNRDIFERSLMELSTYVVQKFMGTVFPDAQLLESDREIIVRAYACEIFGLMIEWLNHSLSEDRREAFHRLCELRAGTTEMMVQRSAKDREKQAPQP